MIIHVNEMYLLINYLISVIISMGIAICLGLPLVPEKPRRFSWTKSAVFPTPIIAFGLLALCYSAEFYWIYNGLALAIITGVVSSFFMKYLFNYVFPEPSVGDINE
ncbi:hypothetical protein MBFIL_03410 [Methanobrevibacter filiformis]|uniref:Probable [NiFe]-hydrogenase-type-3 Eha complex membrane subunit A n=2 Tax=Methanobrevibacter filiformis TaxID=55758 RepID=A0A166EX14_9EURY|nr:energy-converting hydrogenase A subunit A EhaA [Methanobrevibacter filiformis]KZX17105.1 hypothetical protein MBFIL_03410 [Methanobrevibacter filiformis]